MYLLFRSGSAASVGGGVIWAPGTGGAGLSATGAASEALPDASVETKCFSKTTPETTTTKAAMPRPA